MKKGPALFIVLLLILPAAIASSTKNDITVSEFKKHIYNLGDVLVISHEVVQNTDTSAIFKLKLICGSYSLDYFTQPIELRARESKKIASSGLTLQKSMIGTCNVNASLISTTNEILASVNSDSFVITSDLEIEASTDRKSYLPEEVITVLLNIAPTYEEFTGSATFGFYGDLTTGNISGRTYQHTLKIENTTKTGEHDLSIDVRDSHGNKGERILLVGVDAVPTKVSSHLNKDTFKPNEEIRAYVTLTDQAGEAIEGSKTRVTITGPGKNQILNDSFENGKVFTLKLAQDALPGNYSVKTTAFDLNEEKQFSVEEVEQIETTFDNRIVTITNTGNTEYQKPVNISLIKDGNSYSIIRKLSLKPLDKYELDLFREMPEGNYTLTVPNKDGIAVYQDVNIQDERSIGKKLGDAFSPLTGNTVKAGGGAFVMKTFFFLLAFFVIVGVTIGGIRMYKNRSAVDAKKEMQLEKELEAVRTMEKPVAQPKSAPAAVQVPQKTQAMREDPEIRKFVDRILREK